MTSLLILGAGGHGRVVAETAICQDKFSRIAFLDDSFSNQSRNSAVLGMPIIGPLKRIYDTEMKSEYQAAVVGIGNAIIRLRLLDHLVRSGYECPPLVHPTAWVSPSAYLGAGTVVFAQAAVQSQTSIGVGAILNTGCTVDHDVEMANGVHVCPGAHIAGGVRIGERSWIGIGSSVREYIII